MEEKYDREIEGERWEQIPNYEGWYDISDWGNVRRMMPGKSTFIGKILTINVGSSGYPRVNLWKNAKKHQFKTHCLVAHAFLGPRPEGKQINHIDGDKTNNYYKNLEYVTHSENRLHAFRIGMTSNQGENNGRSKLTEKDVHEINDVLGKETYKDIAARYNVSVSAISSIARGASWAYLKEEEEK